MKVGTTVTLLAALLIMPSLAGNKGSEGGKDGGKACCAAEKSKECRKELKKCRKACDGDVACEKKCAEECKTACASSCKHKANAGKGVADEAAKGVPQTLCPVMGSPIDKSSFIDVKGKRIYVCCAGCIGAIKSDPDKYLAKLADEGVVPEDTPAE
jgi:hypothetical protein